MSGNKPLLIALVVVGALIVGFVAWFFLSPPDRAPVSEQISLPAPAPANVVPETTVETADVGEQPTQEEADPEPGFVLPLLDDSDQLVRDGVVSLTRHEGVNAWLGNDELIRKLVVVVDNVGNGSVPKQHIGFLAPQQPFAATRISDDVFVMTDASYERYNQVTDILVSIDSRRAAEFYLLLRPLVQTAYDELGYPSSKFDDAIFKAIGRLLETPVITEPVRLIQPVVAYEYEDRRLEALSNAQKQLLRMGPRNTGLIHAKLSEFALELRSLLSQAR